MPARKRGSRKKIVVEPTGPEPTRPRMPESYGMCGAPSRKGLLPWSQVSQQMAKSRNYWVATTRPDGRPHLMPVWGVWVNEKFCFSTDRRTRKARNLAGNPAMVVHLESGDDVVILEGQAEEITDRKLIESIDAAYFAKYRMHVIGIPGDVGFYALRHQVAFAWRERDFPKSATRWQFAASA